MSESKPMSDIDLASVLRRAIEAKGPDFAIHDGVLIGREHLRQLSARLGSLQAEVAGLRLVNQKLGKAYHALRTRVEEAKKQGGRNGE